ncbi:MAG: DUF2336 domain-containing protein [Pseudomonadota bacterium]|nr:DUF2336 domain-containing protein [Pseudomonadota bacterium]
MMPVEWPIAAEAADHRVEPARAAGSDRLPIVRQDLFLDDRARLTEQERALMSAMLVGMIEQLADELRIGLPPDVLARTEQDRDHIVARLWKSGALDQSLLIQLLLRHADEQLIAAACRTSRGPGEGGSVERLVGDSDGAIASAAMALAVARGRRRDRFGRLGLEYDDIPRREARRLVHFVAAALRHGISGGPVAIDEALAEAAARLIDRHDESRRIELRAMSLAAALVEARGADDELVAGLAAEGDAALLTALCAVRAGVSPVTAWMLLVNDGARHAMLLARIAGIGRPAAAAMVAALTEPLLWGEPDSAIACFDRLADSEVDAARRWWRLPAAYRDGVGQLGGGDGQPID